MSILTGGLFSNPAGKMGGVVFGAARTRTGKKVTSRLLVPPSNPDTVAQQVQRSKFAEALAIVRLIGSGIYRTDFNRAIGQLPGFQSLTSIYLNAMDAISDIGVIPSINLGSLHQAGTMTVEEGSFSGQIEPNWSTELGINGTDEDLAVCIGIEESKGASPLERNVVIETDAQRDAGLKVMGLFTAGANVTCLMYFRGAGTADGLLSPTIFNVGNALA